VHETADDLRVLQDLLDRSYEHAGAHLRIVASRSSRAARQRDRLAGAYRRGDGAHRPRDVEFDERAQGDWLFLHNDYLQTLMEWGWIGGLLWAGILFGGMIVAAQSLRDKPRASRWFPRQLLLLPLAIVALGGVALHALVDFPLQISSIQLYTATYLGICWGAGRWGKAES
jgi:hypothetical protein